MHHHQKPSSLKLHCTHIQSVLEQHTFHKKTVPFFVLFFISGIVSTVLAWTISRKPLCGSLYRA